ncbi:ferredoxin-NADPH reductase [Actinobacteria bacterium YIM 96077]|uniref:Ferredoxin-NADPH reductase n=1 Tax=Phytoactinopolyspora halophila TaxID=1981511 RepID=A0A329QT61_9ACTN|nr:ferredoxin-NADPH reductase [Phytoactinopolyspora halophila]AYY13884.1 ferredoxin-NADPH reductase [Actinobacteria bacterium YIM 96077]RAW15574.1 ferredoxin-NADPH reductase [Phytoactinopolyspora halophila]
MGTTAVARVLRPAPQATYEKIFGTVYVGLMVNVLLAVACSPLLLALAIVRDPIASWPFFLAMSGLCAPALAGAFGCFARMGEDGGTRVLHPFWTTYARTARRAVGVWMIGAVLVGVLLFDALLVARMAWGPALVPFFITTSALAGTVVVGVIVLAVDRPDLGLRQMVRSCVYLLARRWYLATANVAVLGLAVAVVLVKPVIGMLVACAPLLYVAWANTRYALAPLLPADDHRHFAQP